MSSMSNVDGTNQRIPVKSIVEQQLEALREECVALDNVEHEVRAMRDCLTELRALRHHAGATVEMHIRARAVMPWVDHLLEAMTNLLTIVGRFDGQNGTEMELRESYLCDMAQPQPPVAVVAPEASINAEYAKHVLPLPLRMQTGFTAQMMMKLHART